jgi:hypothetical protein
MMACQLACGGDSAPPASEPDGAALSTDALPAAAASATGLPEVPEERDEGSVESDASAPGTDAGADVLMPPPAADWDASVPLGVVGNTYAETQFRVERPAALAKAFNLLIADTQGTRVFVNDIRQGDAGVQVRYGAASAGIDGGLAWQETSPVRTFQITSSADDPSTLVSKPFNYTLRARFPNPASSNTSFLVSLSASKAVWTATVSPDFSGLNAGTLYGTLTREEAEIRPLNAGIGGCALGLCSDLGACAQSGLQTLADLLDCNAAALDADADGDGKLDGYALALAFTSERIPFGGAGH